MLSREDEKEVRLQWCIDQLAEQHVRREKLLKEIAEVNVLYADRKEELLKLLCKRKAHFTASNGAIVFIYPEKKMPHGPIRPAYVQVFEDGKIVLGE